MAKDKDKDDAGTPTESDRKVLERARQPGQAVPETAEVDGGKKIEPVDLSLHGDQITDWRDEPLSSRKAHRSREGKVPEPRRKK